MEKGLELVFYKGLKGIDRKSGREFTYDGFGVKVNNMVIYVKPDGQTSYNAVLDAFDRGLNLVVKNEVIGYEKDGVSKSFEQLYVEIDGEHAPIKAADRFGTKLIKNALNTL